MNNDLETIEDDTVVLLDEDTECKASDEEVEDFVTLGISFLVDSLLLEEDVAHSSIGGNVWVKGRDKRVIRNNRTMAINRNNRPVRAPARLARPPRAMDISVALSSSNDSLYSSCISNKIIGISKPIDIVATKSNQK